MNKEDYVNLEVAKLLAENKIEIPTYYHRISKNINSYKEGDLLHISEVHKNHIVKLYAFPAPTLYEVQKWLRNKHQLHIDVGMCSDYSTDADGNKAAEWTFWSFSTYYTTSLQHIHDCFGEYDTYEEALNEGILEALKLI